MSPERQSICGLVGSGYRELVTTLLLGPSIGPFSLVKYPRPQNTTPRHPDVCLEVPMLQAHHEAPRRANALLRI